MGLREDLLQLLEKHNASIYFDYDDSSDMHCVFGESIIIVENCIQEKVLLKVDGYGIEPSDLKEKE